jgi:hypothetical protein
MPRNGRGGRQLPTAGVPRPNRSDMVTPQAPEPVSVVPGQGYGEEAQQKVAQRALPLAPTQVNVAPGSPGTTSGAGGPGAEMLGGQPPAAGPFAGELTPLTAPTNRPNEPVTAGLPIGPGPGPEAITSGVGQQGFAHANVANLLSSLAQIPGAGTDIANLAAYANSGRG